MLRRLLSCTRGDDYPLHSVAACTRASLKSRRHMMTPSPTRPGHRGCQEREFFIFSATKLRPQIVYELTETPRFNRKSPFELNRRLRGEMSDARSNKLKTTPELTHIKKIKKEEDGHRRRFLWLQEIRNPGSRLGAG